MSDTDDIKETGEKPPVADPVPAPTPEPTSDARDSRLEALEQTVNGLIEKVAVLTPSPQDHNPGGVPWTHRGSRR